MFTEGDLERESTTVLSNAWICYSGEGLNNCRSDCDGISYCEPANQLIDDRLQTTNRSRRTDSLLTCGHGYFNRSHGPSRHND